MQATLDNNVLPHQVLDILPAEEKLVFAEKVLSEIDQLESEYATAL